MNILIGTILLSLAAAALMARLYRLGGDTAGTALERARATMVFIVPRLFVGLLGAGFLAALLPVDRIQALFGEATGLQGVLMATTAGALTPGGPFVAFAIGAVAVKAGAGHAAMVSYTTAWCIVAMTRSVAWEWPIMGRRFLLTRIGLSLPVPILLGAIVTLI